MDWFGFLQLPATPGEWATVLAAPATVGSVGFISAVYGLRKLRMAVDAVRKHGWFKFAKNMNFTHEVYCTLNGAVVLLVALLLLEAIVELAWLHPVTRPYSLAYMPLAVVLAVGMLALLVWVYVTIAQRASSERKHGVLSYLQSGLNGRGFHLAEIGTVPLVTLVFNAGPTLLRLIA